MGCAYYDNGEYEKSAAIFEKMLEKNPEYSAAHYWLGLAYVEIPGHRLQVLQEISILRKLGGFNLADDIAQRIKY